jgi:hypothetical protein
MKSLKYFFIILISFTFISSYGQFFTGGNIQLSTFSNKIENNILTNSVSSGNSFIFNPLAGKFLSGKFAAGIMLNIQFSRGKTENNSEIITNSSTFGASPFLRYYFWKWNRFSAFGEGIIGLDFSKSTTRFNGTSNDGPKQTKAYINIYPSVAFDISDKLSLQTSLNFLSINCYHTVLKDSSGKSISTGFSSGAGFDNIISVGTLNIGAIYKF